MTIGFMSILLLLLFSTITEVNTLTCHYTEYVLRSDEEEECCPKCIPGHKVRVYCTEFQSTSCTVCDDGTYMNKYNGEKHCFKCLVCTEGLREIRSCTFTANSKCEPLEGFFCVDGSVDTCVAAQQHSTCEPGQFIIRAGTSSTDTECGTCSEGTFSNGTFTSCQDHKQCSLYLREGTISSDSVCREGLTPGEEAGIIAMILIVLLITCSVVWFIKRQRDKKHNRACSSDRTQGRPRTH